MLNIKELKNGLEVITHSGIFGKIENLQFKVGKYEHLNPKKLPQNPSEFAKFDVVFKNGDGEGHYCYNGVAKYVSHANKAINYKKLGES